jgi:hypothetical protein
MGRATIAGPRRVGDAVDAAGGGDYLPALQIDGGVAQR